MLVTPLTQSENEELMCHVTTKQYDSFIDYNNEVIRELEDLFMVDYVNAFNEDVAAYIITASSRMMYLARLSSRLAALMLIATFMEATKLSNEVHKKMYDIYLESFKSEVKH